MIPKNKCSTLVSTAQEEAPKRLLIHHNPWVVPGRGNVIEGRPTPEMVALQEAAYRHNRANWQPGPEALALVEKLKDFTGFSVEIQFWDPIMLMLEDEGPYPLQADCIGVVLLAEQDGVLQAYLHIDNPKEIATPEGHDCLGYLKQNPYAHGWIASVSDILEISVNQPKVESLVKKRSVQ